MNNKIDIPQGWEIKKLGEIFNKSTLKNLNKQVDTVLTNSAKYGVILQQNFFDKSIAHSENIDKYYILNIDAFIYNPRISNLAPAGPISRNKTVIGCVSPLYTVFEIKDKTSIDFFEYYFQSNLWNKNAYKIANFGARFDRMNITSSDFFNIEIPIPPLEEQKKIADILLTWDKAITTLKEIIQQKELQKKGLMQNLLTGKKRLDGFNDEWKEVKLGEIGYTLNGLTNKTKDDFNFGSRYISYKDIYNNFYLKKPTNNYVFIKEDEKQTTLKYGDILFTISSETANEVGMSCVILFDIEENIYLNSFSFCFRLNEKNILYPPYASYLLRSNSIRIFFTKLAQGFTRYNLSKSSLNYIIIHIPTSIEEQKAIAEILMKADEEISLLNKQLELYKEQKKGLMQQLLTGKIRVN